MQRKENVTRAPSGNGGPDVDYSPRTSPPSLATARLWRGRICAHEMRFAGFCLFPSPRSI